MKEPLTTIDIYAWADQSELHLRSNMSLKNRPKKVVETLEMLEPEYSS
jgi:hypothetical protein